MNFWKCKDESTKRAAKVVAEYIKNNPEEIMDAMNRYFIGCSIYLAERFGPMEIDNKALLNDLMELDKRNSEN